MGEHGEGDVPVPAAILPYLEVVEPGFACGSLEGFLDGPAGPGDTGQLDQGDVLGCVADEVGQVGGVFQAAAGQQPVFPCFSGAVDADPGLRVEPFARGPGAGGAGAPKHLVQGGEELIGPPFGVQ